MFVQKWNGYEKNDRKIIDNIFDNMQNKKQYINIYQTQYTYEECSKELKKIVQKNYKLLKNKKCHIGPIQDCLIEFWKRHFDKEKGNVKSNFDIGWHKDDFGTVDYKTYTIIDYYDLSKGLVNGGLLFSDSYDGTKIAKYNKTYWDTVCCRNKFYSLDCWDKPTKVIFRGDIEHCPQDTTIEIPIETAIETEKLYRKIIIFFFKRVEN